MIYIVSACGVRSGVTLSINKIGNEGTVVMCRDHLRKDPAKTSDKYRTNKTVALILLDSYKYLKCFRPRKLKDTNSTISKYPGIQPKFARRSIFAMSSSLSLR